MAALAKASTSLNRANAMWFRVDLRLDDNPALHAACQGAASLLPVFVFDPRQFNVSTLAGAKKSSARRARFLLESVASLRTSLESKGSGLAAFLGRPEDLLPELCATSNEIFIQQSICSEEKTVETRLKKHLKSTALRSVWGGSLYFPDENGGCTPSNMPLMFTSFKNKAESRGKIRNPIDAPKQMPPLPELKSADALKYLPTLEQLGFEASDAKDAAEDDPRACMKFPGGEEAARQRVQKWMFHDDKLKDYFEIRNGMLGDEYSSKLSPWLALGCISPRRIWLDAQRYERERVKNKSTYWLIFELTWRDFFIYMGISQGDKLFIPGGITGDMTPWRKSPDALAKWKDGRTNDQLVDANMRELKATGFMSNRGRQNVASYLIFDLGVDWRFGAAHFEEFLLDHDPCSNWGNWIAAAGLTGQRVNKFNTKKQLNDYDPRREYVRHWLEGGTTPAPASSSPSRTDDAKLQARADRFGTGKGEQKGSGKGVKGGRGKGSRTGDGGFEPATRKQARWGKAGDFHDTAQGA